MIFDVFLQLRATEAFTENNSVCDSSDETVFFPSRRKSARENGHDKASSGVGSSQTNNGDKIVVKEANTPEVEIVETLKVKIKPRSASPLSQFLSFCFLVNEIIDLLGGQIND